MKPSPYPAYDVLEKWDSPSWNEATRAVMERRLNELPRRRFFTEREWAVLEALCACAVPQPDRPHPVPIAPWIDEGLTERRGSGTRYASLPDDADAWRNGLAALDAEAQAQEGRGFAELPPDAQDRLLQTVDKGQVQAAEWQGLPPQDFFRKIALKTIVGIYYAHPAAMSEIGYGGPASPRGYVRLQADRADPWEAPFGRWEES